MSAVDDAVAALTPKLAAESTELDLVLKTMAENQTALQAAIANSAATPETLAAIKSASDKADADLAKMQAALAAPPVPVVTPTLTP